MTDERFYESLGPLRLAEIAEIANSELLSPDDGGIEINSAAPLETAGRSDVTYYRGRRNKPGFETTRAGGCFVRGADVALAEGAGVAVLIAENPQDALARAIEVLVRPRALVASDWENADIDASASVAASAWISAGARIAAGVRIGPNAVIGPGVTVGEGGRIGPGAIVSFADIGARCVVHAGAVIGESGFGVALETGRTPRVMPHIGRVVIGDDVEIGSNSTVDRGMFDDTVIKTGSKVDNLVQIAHNVQIGENCLLAGCCGLSGSVIVEDGAVLGGSVGVSDHVRIGAGARLAGASLVMHDVPPGESWAGAPAKPVRTFFREVATLARLARRGNT